MLKIKNSIKIYIYPEHVDMRKAVNGLSAIVMDEFTESPTSGHIFIFYNRNKNRLKCLFWDKNGFVLYYKRIEKRKFVISNTLSGADVELTQTQLQGLLAGFDFSLMSEFSEIEYSDFY